MAEFITLLAPVLAQLAPPAAIPPPPPAPPAPVDMLPESERTRFVSFLSGPVTCDGIAVSPIVIEQPMSSIGYAGQRSATLFPVYRVSFAIDANGRPIDIRADDGGGRQWSRIDASDVVPALTTWQFASGAPYHRCAVAFTVEDQSLPDAPRDELTRLYATMRGDNSYRRSVFDRLRPPGATCYTPTFPASLVQVFPYFDRIPQQPGTTSFSMIDFNIDRHGKPIDVHVATSGGNKVLDAKSVASIRRWRFVDGARTGCLYPYWRRATEPLKAPPPPDVAAYRPADSDCEGHDDWATYPVLTYPQPFRRRSIDGWAIVTYDVAPWGELGDIKVVASEPAAAFGTQAINVMNTARKMPTKRGLYGCVQLVKFVMKPNRVVP